MRFCCVASKIYASHLPKLLGFWKLLTVVITVSPIGRCGAYVDWGGGGGFLVDTVEGGGGGVLWDCDGADTGLMGDPQLLQNLSVSSTLFPQLLQ